MKILFMFVLTLSLSGCARTPIDAPGIYRLSTPEKSMVLDVRTGGEYVLQIDAPGRNTDEIRGRWENERGTGTRIAFHGLVWRDAEPEAGHGIWAASIEGNADICLDAEGLSCFSKDEV